MPHAIPPTILSEDLIERRVERHMDHLDRLYLAGEITRNWYRRYKEERDAIERDNRELDRQEGIATTEEYVRPTYGIRNTGPHDVVRPPE